MSVHVEGYRNESFESLEQAVMETPRGRWFLEEYAKRRRSAESLAILDILRKLETNLTSVSKPAESASPLKPDQLKFFKKDEELFVEPVAAAEGKVQISLLAPGGMPQVRTERPAAPEALVPAVEARPPAEPKGAKLRIQRLASQSQGEQEAAPPEATLQIMEPEKTEVAVPVPQAAPVAEIKQRVIIIRKPASEAVEIPMGDDLRAAGTG